jgi:ureidoacrylate peracid hydrolase
MHKIELPPEVEAGARARRGHGHVFAEIDPARTAHIVIDLQNGFMEPDAPIEVPVAREIVPNVNRISAALREAGGTNVFVRFLTTEESEESWSVWYNLMGKKAERGAVSNKFTADSHNFALWPGLDVSEPADLIVDKTRFGAFVPGASDLHEILQARGIDTLIITGTLSNCCCESTARDAMQMNYKVIFVADGNAAQNDFMHNATLANMAILFADVMTTDEVVATIGAATGVRSAAE